MNAFISMLAEHNVSTSLLRGTLKTLQVNMGNLCNQSCRHCHVEASPQGSNMMSKQVIDDIIEFVSHYQIETLDITGGAPELNPHFEYFVTQARPCVDKLIVRSNLTVFFEPGKENLPQFFKNNNVHLICSLPCYSKDNVDNQRGSGAFEKSIMALQLLNEMGFARKDGLLIDLVYNPSGPDLPPEVALLENDYKRNLKESHGIEFNRLLTLVNVPIKRFKTYLKSRGEYEQYYDLLKSNFNPDTLENLMCRSFLSVGYDGRLYDCDFNQALSLSLKSESNEELSINKLNPFEIEGREITIGTHCLSCAAGCGSSCQGSLTSCEQDENSEKDLGCASSDDYSQDATPSVEVSEAKRISDNVKEYYGKILNNKKDLKTSACCAIEDLPIAQREVLGNIEPEILDRFYGCGSPIPPVLENCTVLDLGCGTGRDVYIASSLVGESGKVIGVDMTDEQLEVAVKYKERQRERFGFLTSNVDFKKGYIEDLSSIGIEDNSIDTVISNCVINLSPDKKKVFKEIFRVLKPGGELYFSDVYSGSRISDELRDDPVLYGECLSGALYIEDFRRMLASAGFLDYRIVTKRKLTISNIELASKIGMLDFYSITVRAFNCIL